MMKPYWELINLTNLLNLRTGLASIVSGILGTMMTHIYGGNMNPLFIGILFLAIVFDWAGAISASKKDGTYASQYGIQGVLRTGVMLLLPAWGTMLDKAMGTSFFFFLLTGGLLFHTLISMSANFKRAGWDKWIPTWALDWIASEIEAKIRRSESRLPVPSEKIVVAPYETVIPLNEQAASIEEGGRVSHE
ncbi:Phage holin family protein [Mesobacillus thioparans]